MSSYRTMFRCTLAVVIATAFLTFPGCGSSNTTTSTTNSGPSASFTPDTPAPGAGTIALLAGAKTGANVDVHVTVTGVAGFFGAAFRIKYDTTALQFNGMTDTTSFLRGADGTVTSVNFLSDATAHPGQILISATRLDPTVAPPVDVTTTSVLVVLNFTAKKAIVAATADGRLDFGDPKQICDGTVVPPGCGAITVTWSGGGVSAQ